MDKNEFLSELEKSLSVLQEDELRDIISEYEQHIDIKVEKGLTEEEAIADFGSLQELTGEILEAYHVRVDYAAGSARNRKKNPPVSGQETFGKLKKMGEKGGLVLLILVKRAGAWISCTARWMWRQACRPFTWLRFRRNSKDLDHEEYGMNDEGTVWTLPGLERHRAGQETETTDGKGAVSASNSSENDEKAEYEQRRKKTGKMAEKTLVKGTMGIAETGIHAICKGIGRLAQWAADAVLWGIRLAWNGCWIAFSIFAGGFGIFSLFAMGLLAILLIQGYPLAGVTIGCTGLVLCMFSAAGLGMSFLWRSNGKKTADVKEVPEERRTESKREDSRERRRIHRPEHRQRTEENQAAVSKDDFEIQQRKEDGQDA